MVTSEQNNEAAFREGLRRLARRPLTRTELQQRLERAGHDPAATAHACRKLAADGYLDDRKLALHYILTRVERGIYGSRRVLAELERRGVAHEIGLAAWREVAELHGVDDEQRLHRLARRRLGSAAGAPDERALRRVYNSLLRSGFEAEAIERTLESFRDRSCEDSSPTQGPNEP